MKKTTANDRYNARREPPKPKVGFFKFEQNKPEVPDPSFPDGLPVQLVLYQPHDDVSTYIGTASIEPIGTSQKVGIRMDLRWQRATSDIV